MSKGCNDCKQSDLEVILGSSGRGGIDIQSLDGSIQVLESIVNAIQTFDLSVVTIYDLNGTISVSPSGVNLRGAETDFVITWNWTKNGIDTGVDTQDYSFVSYGAAASYSSINKVLRQKTESAVLVSKTGKVKGNDGLGNSGSEKILTANILFGNHVYSGEILTSTVDIYKDYTAGTISASDVATYIRTLLKPAQYGYTGNFTGTGTSGTPKYYYYAFPSWMDPSDNLENPATSMTTAYGFFLEGDVFRGGFGLVGRFNVINDEGFTEEYKLYQSISDQLSGFKFYVR
jgi:hypothetical protein